MNCDAIQKRLSAYIDWQLLAGERTEVANHLSECEPCETEWHALQQVKQALRAQPKPVLPTHVRTAIEAQTIHRTTWQDELRLWLIPSLAVAAAAGWLVFHVHKTRLPLVSPQQLEAQKNTPPKHDQVAWHQETSLSKDTQ
jgi:anti-sigma factor RsiW